MFVAAMPVALGAYAQSAGNGTMVYDAPFFADAHPATAMNMIDRLPGFNFIGGDTARGFSGTAGNVLIDGLRPTSKSDNLQTILARIPASNVARIEIIRGGAVGIDMQGHSVVANVIRKTGDSSSIIASVKNRTFIGLGSTPGGSIELTGNSGALSYEASISAVSTLEDNTVGDGHRVFVDSAGVSTRSAVHRWGDSRNGGVANGQVSFPFVGGLLTTNISAERTFFDSGVTYDLIPAPKVYADRSSDQKGEFGLDWVGPVGGTDVEMLFLQRLGHKSDINTSDDGTKSERFALKEDTNESILRATMRYAPSAVLSAEGSVEADYNTLQGDSAYVRNGVAFAVPSADAHVEERRGEIGGMVTWKIHPKWSLEAGVNTEYSLIKEPVGTGTATRSFLFPKPRVVLSWSPSKSAQVRMLVERRVGQIDFDDFVASSSFATSGVSAGNPDIQPDRRWRYRLSYERDFWERGAITLAALHEQITDVVDSAPAPGTTIDAPTNIGEGTSDVFSIDGTLPLDRLGIRGGLLKGSARWNSSAVRDPVTGLKRAISGDHSGALSLDLSQDVQSLKSTWGIRFEGPGWHSFKYRYSQVQYESPQSSNITLYWNYNPTPLWNLRVELANLLPYNYLRRQDNYTGPRSAGAHSSLQDVVTQAKPRFFFEIRKTFND